MIYHQAAHLVNLRAAVAQKHGAYLERSDHLDTRHFALQAAESATSVLKERNDLGTSVLVGQIRSTAVDLLHASGMDHSEARLALNEVACHASQQEPNSTG